MLLVPVSWLRRIASFELAVLFQDKQAEVLEAFCPPMCCCY